MLIIINRSMILTECFQVNGEDKNIAKKAKEWHQNKPVHKIFVEKKEQISLQIQQYAELEKLQTSFLYNEINSSCKKVWINLAKKKKKKIVL